MTQQPKFTPGPWKVLEVEDSHNDYFLDSETTPAYEEVKYNCFLMQAAPEMYKALELADKALESLLKLEGFTTPCHQDIKQALAKARGESIDQPTFTCLGCRHELTTNFNMRTKNYCYMCDPNISLDELLNDNQPIGATTTP